MSSWRRKREQQEDSQLGQPMPLLHDNGLPSREAQPGQNRTRSIDPTDRELPGQAWGEEEEDGKRGKKRLRCEANIKRRRD